MNKLKSFALKAKKAIGVLVTLEGAAAAQGLLSSGTQASITAGLGVAASVVTYVLKNG